FGGDEEPLTEEWRQLRGQLRQGLPQQEAVVGEQGHRQPSPQPPHQREHGGVRGHRGASRRHPLFARERHPHPLPETGQVRLGAQFAGVRPVLEPRTPDRLPNLRGLPPGELGEVLEPRVEPVAAEHAIHVEDHGAEGDYMAPSRNSSIFPSGVRYMRARTASPSNRKSTSETSMPPRSLWPRSSTAAGSPSGPRRVAASATFSAERKWLYSAARVLRSTVPACSARNSVFAAVTASGPFIVGGVSSSSPAPESGATARSAGAGRSKKSRKAARVMPLLAPPSSALASTITAERLPGTMLLPAMKPLTAPP